MSIELNEAGFKYAQQLISEGRVDVDLHGDWDKINPDSEQQDRFVEEHGYEAFGEWHLGVKAGASHDTKGAYSFPYGDYKNVVRSGLIAAEERAAQYHHEAVRQAAADLLKLIDQQ